MECLLTKNGNDFEGYPRLFRPNTGEHDFMTDEPMPDWWDFEEFETGKEASAFTISEMAAMIGKGTKAAEKHWQFLIDCVNSGLSGTVCYNPISLAGFIITIIENGTLPIDEANSRIIEKPYPEVSDTTGDAMKN